MANHRGGRINEEIRKELSQIIQYEIKDPRLASLISVTKVDVTKDLRYAKVFVSIFGNEKEKKESMDALKHSAGFMRREIGQRVNLRYTPQLIMELDNTIENGMHISAILNKIKEREEHDN